VNVVIPPVLLYAFGALLVSLGGVRAYYLGWRKRPETDDDDEADVGEAASAGPEISDEDVEAAIAGRDPEVAPTVEAKSSDAPDGDVEPVETVRPRKVARTGGEGHKRHLLMGLLYVAMGLFLLATTWIGQHPR
jgi:hypothetical protein